jgi:NAD(P)-dependent dehydrogenase (short-subunit alcohol dehydrogenase family)
VQPNTVLITGCSSGIGRATALEFLAEDWIVYATARNPADIQTLGDREGCHIAKLDVTEQDDVDRVVDRIIEEEGHIDCLVNNAGFAQFGPLEDVPTEQVHRQFEVNVYGPHRLIRAVLPHMRDQEDGTIVNVSSVAGRLSFPGGGVYAGSKFAMEAMTDALRGEVAAFDVDAVLIEPGPVETQFTDRAQREVDGGEDVMGIDRSDAYETFYRVFDDTQTLGGGGLGAIPPERVAEDIVNAASSTKPAARYPSGTVARVAVLGRFLPDSVRDALYGLVRKLPSI